MKITSLRTPVLAQKKVNIDEEIVRKTLVKEWIRITEKYARPGVQIPPIDKVRKELLDVGVDAAAQAVADEYFYIFPFMIEGRIREKVEKGLSLFDLADFIEDVKTSQTEPELLARLRDKIRHHVFSELV